MKYHIGTKIVVDVAALLALLSGGLSFIWRKGDDLHNLIFNRYPERKAIRKAVESLSEFDRCLLCYLLSHGAVTCGQTVNEERNRDMLEGFRRLHRNRLALVQETKTFGYVTSLEIVEQLSNPGTIRSAMGRKGDCRVDVSEGCKQICERLGSM